MDHLGVKTVLITCALSCVPASMQARATIGPQAKRHLDGVSLAGRQWLAYYATGVVPINQIYHLLIKPIVNKPKSSLINRNYC